MGDAVTFRRALQTEAMRFSFGWLTAANLVGLLLSLLLLAPSASVLPAPLTYGRWMPLHMEWQLYGWCSLPLVGLVMRAFLRPGRGAVADARFAYAAWSAGLLAGGCVFLAGHVSGKLFLSWHGWTRAFFPLALCLVWSVPATHWLRGLGDRTVPPLRKAAQAVLLLALAAVPFALFFSASRGVYPPVNPRSGGATGHSLLASTLGILGLFGAVPALLGRTRHRTPWFALYWAAYAGAWVVYLLIHHGTVSGAQPDQIRGLAVLLLMVPLLAGHINAWDWPAGARPWLAAFLLWWALLTVDGWVTFLPGLLDRLKFTNGLVAHAHMAMAGMVTAFNMLVLASLGDGHRGRVFGGGAAFFVWNGGCLAMVAVLLWQGWREGAGTGVLFGHDPATTAAYAVRAGAGAAMLLAGLAWFARSLHNPTATAPTNR
jgi:cytochrome c oxidase cbb3-type subunit 1